MKKYIIIAGVNGAGKSTLYHFMPELQGMPRVNTDEITKEIGSWENLADVLTAGRMAVQAMNGYLEQGLTFNQETTLCGKSIIKNIEKAKKAGYIIEMHYVGLDSVDIAKLRVNNRVAKGGHGVSEDIIEKRYKETFVNLKKVLPLCDLVAFYDNSESIRRFAIYKKGICAKLSVNVPEWFLKYV